MGGVAVRRTVNCYSEWRSMGLLDGLGVVSSPHLQGENGTGKRTYEIKTGI